MPSRKLPVHLSMGTKYLEAMRKRNRDWKAVRAGELWPANSEGGTNVCVQYGVTISFASQRGG